MVRTRFFKGSTLRFGAPLLLIGAGLACLAAFAAPNAAATACTVDTGPPLACSQDLNGSVTIASGGLTIAATDLSWGPAITLTGSDLDKAAIGTDNDFFTVNDLTGTAKGWTVTASATQFCGAPDCSTGNTLPATALTFNGSPSILTGTAPTVSCSGSGTCTAAVNATTGYPIAVSSSTTIFSANANTGLGSNKLTSGWWLHIPANTVADTYTSTVTIAVNTNP